MATTVEIKEKIRELKKQNLTLKEIADMCGVSQPTVSRVLNDRKDVYTSDVLAEFTPRQLIDELKARGYYGELKYTHIIKL